MNVVLVGNGNLGKAIYAHLVKQTNIQFLKVFTSSTISKIFELDCVDVVIDASSTNALHYIVSFVLRQRCCLVCATTGYTQEQMQQLKQLQQFVPVVYSANFSIGMNVLQLILRQYASILSTFFQMEIVEMHHQHKKDCPSGTALQLSQILKSSQYRYKQKQIPIASIRAGNVIGEHTLYCFGDQEQIEMTHKAYNRNIYAIGICYAVDWIIQQPCGWYSMEDIVKGDLSGIQQLDL